MMIRPSQVLLIFIAILVSANVSFAKKPKKSTYSEPVVTEKPYLFGWPNYEGTTVELRGGTSKGGPVTLATEASQHWIQAQQEDLTPMQRDQAAIRALSGEYRVSFDFLETVLFSGETQPSKPYRSWATEKVYIVEDTPGFVMLQHILVMYYVDEKGSTQGPAVIKHWRQDWRYEPETIVEYSGHRIWRPRLLQDEERSGQWTQTVYQVDDTPRYALIGQWEHNASFSAWTSHDGRRPLPRREYTVRNDYHALDGINRLTVTPLGWIHEQDNLKRVLDESGDNPPETPFLAREFGINRYERLVDFDFSAGDIYWEKTGAYWARVRTELEARFNEGGALRIDTQCNDQPVYQQFFALAGQMESGEISDVSELDAKIRDTFECLVGSP